MQINWNVKKGKSYVPNLPFGYTVLGSVSQSNRQGAFVVNTDGNYYLAVGDNLRELDHKACQSAIHLKKKGAIDEYIKLRNIHKSQ